MTVKEASIRFNIDEKEIRKRRKDKMIIGARTDGKSVVIPDDTIIIPSKNDIQHFILQIIKYKNNNTYPISRSLCPQSEQLKAVIDYLFKRGFIGEVDFEENISTLFKKIQITDDGFDYVIGYGKYNKLLNIQSVPININPNISISALHVG